MRLGRSRPAHFQRDVVQRKLMSNKHYMPVHFIDMDGIIAASVSEP